MNKLENYDLGRKLYIIILSFGLMPMLLCIESFAEIRDRQVAFFVSLIVCMATIIIGYIYTKKIVKPFNRFIHEIEERLFVDQELVNRTNEQAQALEEIAATIEEVNASIKEISVNAEHANRISQSTLETVKVGESATHDTLGAMGEIFASSTQIREITSVVNDIASQTNILAVNAAVEAARAGEQGRGFAIVAAEIKNLSKKTNESAKEIEKLIKGSIERVERGNKVVQQAAETLQQIVDNTMKTSDVIAEVAMAMHSQAVATRQIESALGQLNLITQENVIIFSSKNIAESLSRLPVKPSRRLI